jgi:surface antigen
MRIPVSADRNASPLPAGFSTPCVPAVTSARQTSGARTIIKLAAIGAVTLCLGACSLSSRTAAVEPEMITASIAKPVKAEGIDSTDAELIKEVVAKSEDAKTTSHELAWSNPDTGNRGTIMAIDKFVGNHGQQCKKFQTTVDSFMGISIYHGETCELRAGFWVLSWFLRDKLAD